MLAAVATSAKVLPSAPPRSLAEPALAAHEVFTTCSQHCTILLNHSKTLVTIILVGMWLSLMYVDYP